MGKAKAGKKIYESLRKALKLADNLPLEQASQAADPAVLNKVDELLMSQGINPKSINTYEDKIKTLITKPDAYSEYRKTLNEVYGTGDARMSEAGFGKQDWYHGTNVPIDEFKKDALGQSTGAQSAKKGFFFAQDPSTASDYAENAKKIIGEDEFNIRFPGEMPKFKEAQYDYYDAVSSGDKESIKKTLNEYKKALFSDTSKDLEDIKDFLSLDTDEMMNYPEELKMIQDVLKSVEESKFSRGENILPVKLRKGDGIKRIDMLGKQLDDIAISKDIDAAANEGKSGVLFKNTYDPVNDDNRVRQNIAAVFNPEQVRSKFAAFDPALNKSKWIMAGTAGATLNMLPEESEASMGKFNSLKKMWQVGDKAFPAANAAEALKVQKAMETKGMVPHGKVLVEAKGTVPVANKPISNMARGIAVPGALGIDSTGSDVLKSGMQGLSDAFGAYRQHIVEPVTDKLKQKLTPDINVQGKQYQTSSPISDMVIDVGADPLTWTSGGAGDALGILDDIATSSEEESPKRNYEGLKSILNKK